MNLPFASLVPQAGKAILHYMTLALCQDTEGRAFAALFVTGREAGETRIASRCVYFGTPGGAAQWAGRYVRDHSTGNTVTAYGGVYSERTLREHVARAFAHPVPLEAGAVHVGTGRTQLVFRLPEDASILADACSLRYERIVDPSFVPWTLASGPRDTTPRQQPALQEAA